MDAPDPHFAARLHESFGRQKAMALIGVKRRGGSNMFRHQLSTMAILLDYKIIDPVLLKAAVIHDLFEDAHDMPGVTEEEIRRIDADGPAVYRLVMEVTLAGPAPLVLLPAGPVRLRVQGHALEEG